MNNKSSKSTNSNSNSSNSKSSMQSFKSSVASELGVNLKDGYNGDLTAKQAGSIGGEMVKRMVKDASQKMK